MLINFKAHSNLLPTACISWSFVLLLMSVSCLSIENNWLLLRTLAYNCWWIVVGIHFYISRSSKDDTICLQEIFWVTLLMTVWISLWISNHCFQYVHGKCRRRCPIIPVFWGKQHDIPFTTLSFCLYTLYYKDIYSTITKVVTIYFFYFIGSLKKLILNLLFDFNFF